MTNHTRGMWSKKIIIISISFLFFSGLFVLPRDSNQTYSIFSILLDLGLYPALHKTY